MSVAKNWMKPLRRLQIVAGAQEGGIAEHELVRDGARRQQPLRPVEVGEDALEQARALDQGALQPAPFLGGMISGTRSMRQGWARDARIGEQIVGDAGLAHAGVELLHAQRACPGTRAPSSCSSGSQCGSDGAGGVDELVEAPRRRRVMLGQAAGGSVSVRAPAHCGRVILILEPVRGRHKSSCTNPARLAPLVAVQLIGYRPSRPPLRAFWRAAVALQKPAARR